MTSLTSFDARAAQALDGLGLLALRAWLAQEFFLAGQTKLAGGTPAPDWFAALAFPFPQSLLPPDVNWLLAGSGECVLAVALLLGCFTRFVALGLLYIAWVAIISVHADLGWAGWNQIETEQGQGFKVPLMMAVMLFALAARGGGRFALERWHGWAGCATRLRQLW